MKFYMHHRLPCDEIFSENRQVIRNREDTGCTEHGVTRSFETQAYIFHFKFCVMSPMY